MQLWRDTKLDMPIVMSHAARYSAYNNIKHLWNLLSQIVWDDLFYLQFYQAKIKLFANRILHKQKQKQKRFVYLITTSMNLCINSKILFLIHFQYTRFQFTVKTCQNFMMTMTMFSSYWEARYILYKIKLTLAITYWQETQWSCV